MATPNRWPPWIEPMKRLTTPTVINSTVPTVLTDFSITVTPHVNARAAVMVDGVVLETTFTAGSFLNMRVLRDGVEVTPVRRLAAGGTGVNSITTASITWTVDLTKETTHALTVEAFLGVAGSSYTLQTASGISMVVMPRLRMPG